jgi:hypothetical protein
MRAVDLMAFRADDDHKMFLRVSHEHEKNYKIKKQYQAYSWGRNDDFQLGYPTLADDKKTPKRIMFAQSESKFDQVSIRDITSASTYTLALSEDGTVYSWGRGHNGHLGNGDE